MTATARLLFALPAFVLLLVPNGPDTSERFAPKWFRFDRQLLAAAKAEPVVRFSGPDESQQHTLQLLSDHSGTPLFFYADVTTPVCSDGVCQPVRIGLYWSLVGDYVGFALPAARPLTKYDSIPVTAADYLKVHQILSDPHSILGGRTAAEMFDPGAATRQRPPSDRMPQLDALSGATSKDYRDAVVAGALYSCHTLWHLVHGDVRNKILNYLPAISSPQLCRRFLYSSERSYQLYALEHLDRARLTRHLTRVLEVIQQADSPTRLTMLRALPVPIWQDQTATEAIYRNVASWDADTQALLIERLADAHVTATDILVRQLESLRKERLRAFLAFLAATPNRLTAPTRARLEEIVREERYAYCYVVAEFLGH